MFKALKIAVAVGSAQDQICSVGSFARAEARGLTEAGHLVSFLEPTGGDERHFLANIPHDLDVLNLHIPSLHDRLKPWNVLTTILKIRTKRPNLLVVMTLHELSEAPSHWRVRAYIASFLVHGIIVNSTADFTMAQRWGKKLTKINLGPTLWNEKLLKKPTCDLLKEQRAQAIDRLRSRYLQTTEFSFKTPWVLHAGLLTSGKGIEQLKRWCHDSFLSHGSSAQFVLAGGFGPKERDHIFANEIIKDFRSILGKRFTFILEPTDSEYADLLVGSDLLILPYDAGVSERRSSFLAACASGANIWTTTSDLSNPLELDTAGVFTTSASETRSSFSGLTDALDFIVQPQNEALATERRLKNLCWARSRTWPVRVEKFCSFINSLKS